MPKKKHDPEEDIKVYVCLHCLLAIVIFENSLGEPSNQEHIKTFLKKHPYYEMMSLKDYHELSKKKLQEIKSWLDH